ncbi:MAG TPA: hypothetical protein VFS20_11540 [Longimicrobium sp.]|nr:hypothetical protein [Longimicrobium sp.]
MLSLEQRMAFCVWGAVGDYTAERAVWRVITHTVLLDEAAFRALAGNPFALLHLPEANEWLADLLRPGAFDQRRELRPIAVPATLRTVWASESERRREMVRLRARLLDLVGADGLVRWLAALYAALAAAPSSSVVLSTSDDHRDELLIRLAWLSLPLRERTGVTFSTEQGATAGRVPRLAALDPTEWRGRSLAAFRLSAESLDSVSPTHAQRAWAAAVVWDEPRLGDREDAGQLRRRPLPLAAHGRAHARASAMGVRLLVEDGAAPVFRFAALRDAVAAPGRMDAGALMDALGELQRSRLLARPGFSGFLLGMAARRLAHGPVSVAERVLGALLKAPADVPAVRARMVRGAIRALANDALAAAGVLRALSVTKGGLAPETLEPLASRGSEARAGHAAVQQADGAEAVLHALAKLNGRGGDFGALSDAAVLALTKVHERYVAFLATVEPSAEAAPWIVSLHLSAESTGIAPNAGAILKLFRFRDNPDVRHYLSRESSLRAVLRECDPNEVRSYLAAVEPPAASLAAALLHVVVPTGAPVGVAEAISTLSGSSTASVAEALRIWRESTADAQILLRLYLDRGWGGIAEPERVSGAIALLSRKQAFSPALVCDLLDRVAGSRMVLHAHEMELVGHALTLLAHAEKVGALSMDTWRSLLSRSDSAALDRLHATLAELARSGRSQDALHRLSVGIMVRAVETGNVLLLEQGLAATPPVRYPQHWRDVIDKAPPASLATPSVLAAFAAADRDPELSRVLFITALRGGPYDISEASREALFRIGWAARGSLRLELPAWIDSNTTHALSAIFQLMAHPAPIDLLIELEDAVLPFAGDSGQWWPYLERYEERLAMVSPGIVDAFRPRPPFRRKVLLLPQSAFAALWKEALFKVHEEESQSSASKR